MKKKLIIFVFNILIQCYILGYWPIIPPPLSSVAQVSPNATSYSYPSVPLRPVPTPPPNLSSLTEEELRQMEGNLRAAVEARIETLRRVQLLLDAATAMMGQYNSAAATVV